jgi:hypothetical protein
MSNQYHLLLETPSGNLSQIMRHINGAYRGSGRNFDFCYGKMKADFLQRFARV